MKKRLLSLLLAVCLLLGLGTTAFAAEAALDETIAELAAYLCRTVEAPQTGSIGGDWTVLGLARSGYEVPEQYYRQYRDAVEKTVKSHNGVLHEKKYTEYSRVILALSAIGVDARSVAGYDLTKPLGDYDKTVRQGINGPIWALIALDSRQYPMPVNPEAKTQATRQRYLDDLLDRQLPGGGWSLTGQGAADPDVTGMALQALAKYQQQEKVQVATQKALDCMSKMQDETGGFTCWQASNSESVVQMICALCELGIPLDDPRFVKNGKTMLDHLLTFYQKGSGFRHTAAGSSSDLMATEQGFYALVAVQRAQQGKNSLYRMDDVQPAEGGAQASGAGLPGKHSAVKSMPPVQPGKTFADISGTKDHANRQAIEGLAARGIIDGKGGGLFDPDATMTRAEFAAIIVRGLGLEPEANHSFTDVKPGDWFAGSVGTAASYGIITGRGEGKFDPNGTITRQEAAVMVARAAKLCGMDTQLDPAAVQDTLAQFSDYTQTGQWTRQGLAFCYAQGILEDSALEIRGTERVRRCEIAQMLYNLLDSAKLL